MRVKSRESRVESRILKPGVRARLAPRSSLLALRPAMTLIELLVVIIILVTLVAAAIPLISPTNDDRRLREASRGLNAFITGAQIRSIETQRPFGIAIKRLSQDTNADAAANPNIIDEDNSVSVELYYVEQPSPFVGFDESSAAQIAIDNSSTGGEGQVLVRFVQRGNTATTNSDRLPVGWDPGVIPPGTIRPGDVVEIRGSQFRLSDSTDLDANGFYTQNSGTPDGTLVTVPINDTGQAFDPVTDNDGYTIVGSRPANAPPQPAEPYWSRPSPYKILRQPAPTSDPPFQMPEGTSIDLRASGVGVGSGEDDVFFYYPLSLSDDPHPVVNNADGILIMFAPEGRVSRVTFSGQPGSAKPYDQPVVDNLFLLVGRRENAPPPAVTNDQTLVDGGLTGTTEEQRQEIKETINWLRGESKWIAIGATSGRVVTVENAFVEPQALIEQVRQNEPMLIGTPNEQLRNRQIKAAREFAREMTQTGGR